MAKQQSAGRDDLAAEVARFIEGDYAGARAGLESIDSNALSDGDRVTYFLYLGRARMALGDYSAASDAFLVGRQYGDSERFDAYLSEVNSHLQAGSGAIAREARITRAQLAKQLADAFDGASSSSVVLPADVASHWSREYAQRALANGWMTALPDGNFHPEAFVTRAAFAVVVSRLDASTAAAFEGAVYKMTRDGAAFVSGSETAGVLSEIASASR